MTPPSQTDDRLRPARRLDRRHFDEEVRFLQELVRVPTDTPPGNNAPHAERTAELLQDFGFDAEKHAVPAAEVQGLRPGVDHQPDRAPPYGDGAAPIALNAHGDVVPPGEGWTHDPYGGEIEDGKHLRPRRGREQERLRELHLRRARARSLARPLKGASNCTSPTTRSSAANSAPAGCCKQQADQARPDDRGRLQLRSGHRAQRLPADGSDGARQDGARRHPAHRRRRAAGRGADPERAVRAERAVPAGHVARSRASSTPT